MLHKVSITLRFYVGNLILKKKFTLSTNKVKAIDQPIFVRKSFFISFPIRFQLDYFQLEIEESIDTINNKLYNNLITRI